MTPRTNSYQRRLVDRTRALRNRFVTEGVRRAGRSIGRDDVQTKVIALVITAAVVLGLTFVSASAGGVAVTLTGDEEVAQDDVVTLEMTVDHKDGERVHAEGYLLTITDQEEGTLEVVFAADGTPVATVTDSEKIDEKKLDPTLEDKTVAEFPGYEFPGYEKVPGYEFPGYEEAPGYEHVDAPRTYKITMDATAFDVNEYDVQIEIITEKFDEADVDEKDIPAKEVDEDDDKPAYEDEKVHKDDEYDVDEKEVHKDDEYDDGEKDTYVDDEIDETVAEDTTIEEVHVGTVDIEQVTIENLTVGVFQIGDHATDENETEEATASNDDSSDQGADDEGADTANEDETSVGTEGVDGESDDIADATENSPGETDATDDTSTDDLEWPSETLETAHESNVHTFEIVEQER